MGNAFHYFARATGHGIPSALRKQNFKRIAIFDILLYHSARVISSDATRFNYASFSFSLSYLVCTAGAQVGLIYYRIFMPSRLDIAIYRG